MPRSDGLNLRDPLRSDESSSLRERFKPALQSKSHAFEQTSVDDVGEGMPIQNSMKVGRESQSASDLSQTSKEQFGARHLRAWGESSSGSRHRKRLRRARCGPTEVKETPGSPRRSRGQPRRRIAGDRFPGDQSRFPPQLRQRATPLRACASRSRLRALSSTRFTKGAKQRAQPEPTSPVAPTMSSVDLRRSRPSSAHIFLMP